MNKEELLELKNIKQKELNEIEKQLKQIYDQEFLEAESYVGKYYNMNNSNVYFYIEGYNKGVLYGTEIVFTPVSLNIYDEEVEMIDGDKYTEISKDRIRVIVKEYYDYLIKKLNLC